MALTLTNNDYIASFDPKEYLQECFDGLDDEHIFNIEFLVDAIQQLPPDLMVLEVGSGPTLLSAAAIAPHTKEMHLSDYVPANLNEIQLWLDQRAEAFDWTPFIKVALAKEGLPTTTDAVEQRSLEMQRKITKLLLCDVRQPAPLGHGAGQYDLVLAPHCTDVAVATVSQWMEVMGNVSGLVKPGGWLFIAVTTGATHNTVGPRVFACVDLTDEDIYAGYRNIGYDSKTYRLAKIQADSKYEYTGICYAIAQKQLPTNIQNSTNSK